MKYYLIFQQNELHLYRVDAEKQAAFLKQYWLQILASGSSILEVLRTFDDLPLIMHNGH
jgi:hypothetical protein